MTPADTVLSRPEFETVDLDVAVDDVHRRIAKTVKGLRAAETDEGTKYRTTDGMLVAIVGPRPSGSGDTRAQLAYRTAPPSESATRKAAKVSEALAEHAIGT
jgi:hypothetical protein